MAPGRNEMLKKYIRSLIFMTVFVLPDPVLNFHGIIPTTDHSSSDTESMHDQIERILRLCFTDTNRLIILIGNLSHKLAAEIHESEFTAVTRMSNEVPSLDVLYTIAKQSLMMYFDDRYFRFEHRAQGFLLAANSQPVLRQQIQELKNSRWWKADGVFMVIDDSTMTNESCKNAQRFLWLAWRSNMLSTVFICHEKSGELTMYSYNPYNSIAPKNWLKVREYQGRLGHPWILFKRNASDSPEKCGEVFFDKTKTLDNYKIRSNVVPLRPRLVINRNKTGLDRYDGEEGKMVNCIFHFLNASVKDMPYRGKDPLGYTDKNGTYYGMLADVFSGRVEIGLTGRYMVNSWKLGMSYPHASSDFCFLIKSEGYVPQWMNLALAFDLWMNLGLVTVILLTTGVLSYHSTISAGCLNGLRLLISTALVKLPSRIPTKIFLASVLLLWLIANGTFQGRLISLLTKPRAYYNPETEAELGKAGHTVLGYSPMAEYIEDPVLRSHFATKRIAMYNDTVIRTEHVAYIIDCQIIGSYFKNLSELHTVSQRLQIFHRVFFTTMDWPLLSRFDQIVQRLVGGGLPNYWRDRDPLAAFANDHGSGSSIIGRRSPSLSTQDLAFIFHVLLFGLLLSTLVFIYEVLSTWYRIKLRRTGPANRLFGRKRFCAVFSSRFAWK